MSKKPNIISMINHKGGVAKTTSTLNIASFLALARQNVLVVDMDPQANTSATFLNNEDLSGSKTILSLLDQTLSAKLTNKDKTKLKLEKYIRTIELELDEKPTLDLIPASFELREFSDKYSDNPNREKALKKTFLLSEEFLEKYDYILIDCPPSMNTLTQNAFIAADYLFVPVDSSGYAKDGLIHLIEAMGELNKHYNNYSTQIIGIFFTNVLKNEISFRKQYDDLKEECGDILFKTVVRKNTKLRESPIKYKTILEYAPQSNGYKDYYDLTIELVEKIHEREASF